MAKEIKDNKLGFVGTIVSSTNKMFKDEAVNELKVRIASDKLDGKRDALETSSHKPVLIELTPSETEFDLDE